MINHLAETPNKPIIDVVVDSAGMRLRPIVLTTITTVIGMGPLIFANATWAPLALSVMFGLSFAIVLTLVVVPVMFYKAQDPNNVSFVRSVARGIASLFRRVFRVFSK